MTLHEEDDRHPGMAPVESLLVGAYQHGIFDLAGNMFEWIASLFAHEGSEPRYVVRGGAFNSTLGASLTALR